MGKIMLNQGNVIIRRTSWKDENYNITACDVSLKELEKCIAIFKESGVVEVIFHIDSTGRMHVTQLDTELEVDA